MLFYISVTIDIERNVSILIKMSSNFSFTWNLQKKSYTHSQISQLLIDSEFDIYDQKTVLNWRKSEKKEEISSNTVFHIFVIIFNIFPGV